MLLSKRHLGSLVTVFCSVWVMLTIIVVKLIYRRETNLIKLFFYRSICFIVICFLVILFNKRRIPNHNFSKYMFNPYVYLFAISHTGELSFAYYVLSYTTVGNHASFSSTGIILAIPMATLLLKQKMKWVYVPCILLTIIGTAILIQPEYLFGGNTSSYSVVEVLGIVAWVIFTTALFMSYRYVKGLPYDMLLFYDAICCMISYGCVCLASGHAEPPSFEVMLLVVAWAFLVVTGLCMEMFGTQLLPMAEVSTIRSFDKVWGYFFGFIFLDEELTIPSIVGSALILMAIILIVRSKDGEENSDDELQERNGIPMTDLNEPTPI